MTSPTIISLKVCALKQNKDKGNAALLKEEAKKVITVSNHTVVRWLAVCFPLLLLLECHSVPSCAASLCPSRWNAVNTGRMTARCTATSKSRCWRRRPWPSTPCAPSPWRGCVWVHLFWKAMYSRARDASRAKKAEMVGRSHLLVAREQRCQLSDFVATFSEYSDPSIKLFF